MSDANSSHGEDTVTCSVTNGVSNVSENIPVNNIETSKNISPKPFSSETHISKLYSSSFPNENSTVTATTEKNIKTYHSKNYVATYRKKAPKLSDAERKDLIKNVFVPDDSFSFPKSNSRSFRLEWLKQFPWLCYSPSEDGAYCLSCILLGHTRRAEASRVKNLYSQPAKY